MQGADTCWRSADMLPWARDTRIRLIQGTSSGSTSQSYDAKMLTVMGALITMASLVAALACKRVRSSGQFGKIDPFPHTTTSHSAADGERQHLRHIHVAMAEAESGKADDAAVEAVIV